MRHRLLSRPRVLRGPEAFMHDSTFRRAVRATAVAALAAVAAGCTKAAPETKRIAWDDAACDGTEPGRACITLRFSVSSSVRDDATALTGWLEWSLYADGDVGGLGPGDAQALYGGEVRGVDLSPKGEVEIVHVPDAEARRYQVLGYLDVDENGTDDDGDPVTLPSDGFAVPADQNTAVEVVFDYIE
jgi:hypothetical protein